MSGNTYVMLSATLMGMMLALTIWYMIRVAALEDDKKALSKENEDMDGVLTMCENAFIDYKITLSEKFQFIPADNHRMMTQRYCLCFAETAEQLVGIINKHRRNV